MGSTEPLGWVVPSLLIAHPGPLGAVQVAQLWSPHSWQPMGPFLSLKQGTAPLLAQKAQLSSDQRPASRPAAPSVRDRVF